MPRTTSTALPSFSHDQHHKTDAAKRKGGGNSYPNHIVPNTNSYPTSLFKVTSRTVLESMLGDQRVLRYSSRVVTVRERKPIVPWRLGQVGDALSVDSVSEKSTSAPVARRGRASITVCVDENTKIPDCRDWFDNALAHSDVQFVLFSQVRRWAKPEDFSLIRVKLESFYRTPGADMMSDTVFIFQYAWPYMGLQLVWQASIADAHLVILNHWKNFERFSCTGFRIQSFWAWWNR